MSDDREHDVPASQRNRQGTQIPGKGARNTILLIGLLSIGSIACMCAFIFTLVAL